MPGSSTSSILEPLRLSVPASADEADSPIVPTGPLIGGASADPLLGCKPAEEVVELRYGVFGLETDPLFLDRADALKWPHFGHVYSTTHTHTRQYG